MGQGGFKTNGRNFTTETAGQCLAAGHELQAVTCQFLSVTHQPPAANWRVLWAGKRASGTSSTPLCLCGCSCRLRGKARKRRKGLNRYIRLPVLQSLRSMQWQ